MKFTDDGTIAILSPTEMREARHLCGWTLATLSRYAEISIAQLSTYENGLSGLRADQVRLCMELLLGGIAERAEQIQNLIATAQQKRRTSLPSDMPSQSQSR
jgi:transcriptional regulator with XRE-family HTH domain